MIRILGATGQIQNVEDFVEKVLMFSQRYNVVVQVLDAEVVYGEKHLLSAGEHAIRAMKQKRNSTNSLAMEILLYASGERQIKLGIQKMGVKKGASVVAFVMIDKLRDISEANGNISNEEVETFLKTLKFRRDDKVLEGDIDTLQRFGITEQEINTVTSEKHGHLILEKVAMVDVIK